MTDLSGMLQGAEGDGVHWTLETPGELNVNLVHLDAGHAIGEHVNDRVDVVLVVLAGAGRLAVDGRSLALTAHVVAQVPRGTRRSLHAANDRGLDYLSIHRRPDPLGITGTAADTADAGDAGEGGDPACWAHLFEDGDPGGGDPP